MTNSHSSKNFFKKEFSAGCQPRYPVKIPITTWKSLSPPRGLQLYPSCQARCPVKTSYEMETLTCSICSPTFNDALTSGTSLFLLLLYSIHEKKQLKFTISTFFPAFEPHSHLIFLLLITWCKIGVVFLDETSQTLGNTAFLLMQSFCAVADE